MRYITFDEYLAAANVTNEQLKVRRQRDLKSGSQIALAFGRGNNHGYQTDRYIELDAVASQLADVLAEKLNRTLGRQLLGTTGGFGAVSLRWPKPRNARSFSM